MASENVSRSIMENALRRRTRRHFFADCGVGLGSMALASLILECQSTRAMNVGESIPARGASGPASPAHGTDLLAARPGHLPARAKSVIYLFMAGGPSQLELFDYKPQLQRYSGQPIPDSFIEGRRFAFMDIFTK